MCNFEVNLKQVQQVKILHSRADARINCLNVCSFKLTI